MNTHLNLVIATSQGHMHQEQQNLQSTKVAIKDYKTKMEKLRQRIKTMQALKTKGQTLEKMFIEEIENDTFPQSPSPNIKTNDVVYILINKEELGTAYTD